MDVQKPTLVEHFSSGGPKRILALDGGGVRGVLSLGFLAEIEALLRRRHDDDPEFRLSDYFDLIAGTSTGSIIAALLAQGKSVREVKDLYLELAADVFSSRWWEFRLGLVRPRYKPKKLMQILQRHLGATCAIGDLHVLKTGLMVMCKRIDSGSPWPMSNNPNGRYYDPSKTESKAKANKDYLLWQVVRASTAAPTFFKPEKIPITTADDQGGDAVHGLFMDGGVSPHNNPALQAYWLASLRGYGLRWTAGKDNLLIISVGTGRTPDNRNPGWISMMQGITALQSLMDDCSTLVESLMQGMGHCLNAQPRIIDPELGTLSPHELTLAPRFSYARYDVKLYHAGTRKPRDGQDDDPFIDALGLEKKQLSEMQKMDNTKPVHSLLGLGSAAAQVKVKDEHFPPIFDLRRTASTAAMHPSSAAEAAPPPADPSSGCSRYRQRAGSQVTAIQLNLDLEAFRFHKWGGIQTAKQGDWLVERDGQAHTVDADSFTRTYRQIGPATYVKHSIVWAKTAQRDGSIPTREGTTHYRQGDVLAWNDPEGKDGYAMTKEKFDSLYQPFDPDS
jgi:hypothetical protein